MANYEATTRSNYFRVNDERAFFAWCDGIGLEWWKRTSKTPEAATEYAMTADTGDCGGWPTYRWNADNENYEEIDFFGELAMHLAPDTIAIVMEIGNEKLRFLQGYATAVHPDARTVAVSLSEIYERVEQTFGSGLTITEADW